VRAGQAQHPGQPAGNGAAHLNRGPFPTSRAAEEVGEHGGNEDEREHAQRHPVDFIGGVDLIEQEVVAPGGAAAKRGVRPGDQNPGERQPVQQPRVVGLEIGGPIERDQEEGAGEAARGADQDGEQRSGEKPAAIE